MVAANAGTPTAAGSKLVRRMVEEPAGRPHLVYTPAYDPDANRIEWPWRTARRAVTHGHRQLDLAALEAAARDRFAHPAALPEEVLAHIGSPVRSRAAPEDPPPLAA